MKQTIESAKAFERDSGVCIWCLYRLKRTTNVFQNYASNYHPAFAGTHHILGRSRVDDERAIVTLCNEHHYKQENMNKPSKEELADLMLEVYGYDLRTLWPSNFK